jgi:hypothetical protein
MKSTYNPDITIRWEHLRGRDIIGKLAELDIVISPNSGQTTCLIEQRIGKTEESADDIYVIIANASVKCYYKDTFCKADGRKRSLARALNQCNILSFHAKAMIAQQYIKEHKDALNYSTKEFFQDIMRQPQPIE